MISFFSEKIDLPEFDQTIICSWLVNASNIEKKVLGDLNYIFCNDDYLLQINIDYLKHNYYTDVITFDYTEQNVISGDIFISVDRISENAKEYSSSFNAELFRIMIHGFLHLVGYTDKSESDKKEMTHQENFYLDKLSIL